MSSKDTPVNEDPQQESEKIPIEEQKEDPKNKSFELSPEEEQLKEECITYGKEQWEILKKEFEKHKKTDEITKVREDSAGELWKLRGFPATFGFVAYVGLSYVISKYAWDDRMYNDGEAGCEIIIGWTRFVAYYCYLMTALFFILFLFNQLCKKKDDVVEVEKENGQNIKLVKEKQTRIPNCMPELVLLAVHFILWALIFSVYLVNLETGEDCGEIMNVITCITILNVIGFALLVLTIAYIGISVDWEQLDENFKVLQGFGEQKLHVKLTDISKDPKAQDLLKRLQGAAMKKVNENKHYLDEAQAQLKENMGKLDEVTDKLNETVNQASDQINEASNQINKTVQETSEQVSKTVTDTKVVVDDTVNKITGKK